MNITTYAHSNSKPYLRRPLAFCARRRALAPPELEVTPPPVGTLKLGTAVVTPAPKLNVDEVPVGAPPEIIVADAALPNIRPEAAFAGAGADTAPVLPPKVNPVAAGVEFVGALAPNESEAVAGVGAEGAVPVAGLLPTLELWPGAEDDPESAPNENLAAADDVEAGADVVVAVDPNENVAVVGAGAVAVDGWVSAPEDAPNVKPEVAGAAVAAGVSVFPNAFAVAEGLASAAGGAVEAALPPNTKPAPTDGAGAVVALLGFVSFSFVGPAAGTDPPKDTEGAVVAEVFESVPNENDGALTFDLSSPNENAEDPVAVPELLLVVPPASDLSELNGFVGVAVVDPNENDNPGVFAGVASTGALEAGSSSVFFGAGVAFPKAKAAAVVPFLGGVVTDGIGDFDGVNIDVVEVELLLDPPLENFPFLELPIPISVVPSSFIARHTHSSA
mmetsp:Transcript_4380/g.8903  ORF Transcript_4380/g.8903 Transcript_4380/m.8903 type:complete len:446 (-) Transcript_4380:879-2216(-)